MSMIWSVLSAAVQLHKGNSCWNITGGLPVSPSIYHTHSGQLSPEREDTTKTSARWPRTHNPSDVCTAVMSSLLGGWQSAPLWCAPLRVLSRACCFLFCVVWWEADTQTGNESSFDARRGFFQMLHLCLVQGWSRPVPRSLRVPSLALSASARAIVTTSDGSLDLMEMSLPLMCVYMLCLRAAL